MDYVCKGRNPVPDYGIGEVVEKGIPYLKGANSITTPPIRRIWDGMSRGIAPADTYRQIGGVGGALAGEAERIYQQLPEAEQRIAKRAASKNSKKLNPP